VRAFALWAEEARERERGVNAREAGRSAELSKNEFVFNRVFALCTLARDGFEPAFYVFV